MKCRKEKRMCKPKREPWETMNIVWMFVMMGIMVTFLLFFIAICCVAIFGR